MTAVIDGRARLRSLALIDADRVLWPEAVLTFDADPERVCEMVPEDWPKTCNEAGEHAADLEVLFSCGLVVSYCQNAYDHWVVGTNIFDCTEDHGSHGLITVVVVERLR